MKTKDEVIKDVYGEHYDALADLIMDEKDITPEGRISSLRICLKGGIALVRKKQDNSSLKLLAVTARLLRIHQQLTLREL